MQKNILPIPSPSIEMVKGFYSNGVHCGLKKDNALDLGIVYSEVPAQTYALYTTNKVQGAPLKVAQHHLLDNQAQALVVNSKIANTCTGQQGIEDAEEICLETAKLLQIRQNDVIPMSTGIIGEFLPVQKIKKGLQNLKKTYKTKNDNCFAKAIMTTDTCHKVEGIKVQNESGPYTIVGTAKGAGMVCPNMATMLTFIFTDCQIKDELLKTAFINAIEKSFNSITIDGDMSTNDTAIIFDNKLAENALIDDGDSQEYADFCEALQKVTLNLAKLIVKDGEGTTKVIEITVQNAKTIYDAKKACKAVALSNLVKTAFFGEDANWGRILCALGYSGVPFKENEVILSIGDLVLFKNGMKTDYDEGKAKMILQKPEISVNINIQSGNKSWSVWTNDLSYDYIKINAGYRT